MPYQNSFSVAISLSSLNLDLFHLVLTLFLLFVDQDKCMMATSVPDLVLLFYYIMTTPYSHTCTKEHTHWSWSQMTIN